MKSAALDLDRTQDIIEKIRNNLKNKPRDLLLFDFLTQTGAPIRSLLKLKRTDVEDLQPGEKLYTKNFKGIRNLYITKSIHESLSRFFQENRPSMDDYLFASRKKQGPLTLPSVSRMVRGWFHQAGIVNTGGIRSLKKAWKHHYKIRPDENMKPSTLTYPHSILKPVHFMTVQEKVLNELENAILSGRITPGERLITEEIAQQMNVSRMPVREALGRLEARGLINIQKKGFSIRELSKSNLEEISEIRLMLEPAASKTAALFCTDSAIVELDSTFKQLAQANERYEVDEVLRLNKEFHFTIYKESVKPMLLQLIEITWEKISPYFHIMMRNRDKYDQTFDSKLHFGMLKGMKNRDPEEVSKWITMDINHAAKSVMNLFDGEPSAL